MAKMCCGRPATTPRPGAMTAWWPEVPCRDYLAAQCLEACGFRLADVSVEWLLNLERAPGLQYLDEGYSVGDPEDGDAPVLCRLAAESLCDLDAYSDRFALDPGMRGGCPEMYSRWMANCLSGDQADTVPGAQGAQGPGGLHLPAPRHGPRAGR